MADILISLESIRGFVKDMVADSFSDYTGKNQYKHKLGQI